MSAHAAHDPREDAHPDLAEAVGGGVAPEHPGGDDEVCLVFDQGLEHDRDLGGIVLPVGVEGDDEAGPQLHAQGVAHPQRVAVAQVL